MPIAPKISNKGSISDLYLGLPIPTAGIMRTNIKLEVINIYKPNFLSFKNEITPII